MTSLGGEFRVAVVVVLEFSTVVVVVLARCLLSQLLSWLVVRVVLVRL